VALVIGGIALLLWVQAQPLIDGGKASSIALDNLAGPDHSRWTVASPTLDYTGTRPHVGDSPGDPAQPKCWGMELSIGDGYCLPYPVWRVHLIQDLGAGQCSYNLSYVDARRARVPVIRGSGPEPCGAFPPELARSAQGPA
jgi:hypothetical protein